jgi:hypothetical protein
MKSKCLLLLTVASLVMLGMAAEKKATYHPATNRDFITAFERPPSGWVAGFRSVADWKGERGFSAASQATQETGQGWFSVNGMNPYQSIRAPKGADYAVCEGQHNADHTQLHGLPARQRAKAGEAVNAVEGSYDITVAFQDDGTARTRGVLNSFFQIFEESKEHGWRPAYALFFMEERLLIGAWDDNPAVPGVTLRRGQWYRIRFDVTLRNDGAQTVLSVWPVDAKGQQGPPQVSALVIEHRKGLSYSGLVRNFPAMPGCYTWRVPGKEPYSAATLISTYRQNDSTLDEKHPIPP